MAGWVTARPGCTRLLERGGSGDKSGGALVYALELLELPVELLLELVELLELLLVLLDSDWRAAFWLWSWARVCSMLLNSS